MSLLSGMGQNVTEIQMERLGPHYGNICCNSQKLAPVGMLLVCVC